MKLYAITENHLYSKAYSKGKKAVGRTVCIYILPDYHAKRLAKANPMKKRINRIGLTVTKKIGGAVTRNRVKRIMREAYYKLNKTHTVKTGFLIVMSARDSAKTKKSEDIYSDMCYLFSKLEMITPKEQ